MTGAHGYPHASGNPPNLGHLMHRPDHWDDLCENHRAVMLLIDGYRKVTGKPLHWRNRVDTALLQAVRDLLPSEMTSRNGDETGSLALTLLELDAYGAIVTTENGTELSSYGRCLLGSPWLADHRVGRYCTRIRALDTETSEGDDPSG